MGGRKEVSIISHRPVTRSDLKEERSFFRGSVSTVLQPRLYLFISFVPPGHFLMGRPEKSSFYFPPEFAKTFS